MLKPVQYVAEQRAFGLEIETVEGVVVEESAVIAAGPSNNGAGRPL